MHQLITTADGSHTFYIEELDEHYHSVHGAVQESIHVFIKNGLYYFPDQSLKILEVGFGTGLNTLQTVLNKKNKSIDYTSLDAFPLTADLIAKLNYTELANHHKANFLFESIHAAQWNLATPIDTNFNLLKRSEKVQDADLDKYDLIYFDAFGPRVQPEMWTVEIFSKLYKSLNPLGVLVTYCAKGKVKRDLKSCGFVVESLPGPPGKREMIRAVRIDLS